MKNSRIEQLVGEFHRLAMKEGETIREFELRLTHLINNLAALGKEIPESDQISKVLNNLSEKWGTKATVVKEAQGLIGPNFIPLSMCI